MQKIAVINRSGIIYTDITKYTCFPGVLSPVSTFKQKVIFSCRTAISDQQQVF